MADSRYKKDPDTGSMVYQFRPSEMVDAATLAKGRPLAEKLDELSKQGYTEIRDGMAYRRKDKS